jgi:hypothetical protein
MSFKTAKDHFEAASQDAPTPFEKELATGLLELTKTLQREISDMESRLRTIESEVKRLR